VGSAALLVGLGLGYKIYLGFISGIILLIRFIGKSS
jgi:hypothetical protein